MYHVRYIYVLCVESEDQSPASLFFFSCCSFVVYMFVARAHVPFFPHSSFFLIVFFVTIRFLFFLRVLYGLFGICMKCTLFNVCFSFENVLAIALSPLFLLHQQQQQQQLLLFLPRACVPMFLDSFLMLPSNHLHY